METKQETKSDIKVEKNKAGVKENEKILCLSFDTSA